MRHLFMFLALACGCGDASADDYQPPDNEEISAAVFDDGAVASVDVAADEPVSYEKPVAPEIPEADIGEQIVSAVMIDSDGQTVAMLVTPPPGVIYVADITYTPDPDPAPVDPAAIDVQVQRIDVKMQTVLALLCEDGANCADIEPRPRTGADADPSPR